MRFHAVTALAIIATLASGAGAQQADPGLMAAVRAIRAIDDHAHPPALPVRGVADANYDALPCPPGDPTQPTLVSRPENPAFLAGAKALFHYPYSDWASDHVRALVAATAQVQRQQGQNYPDWVLDQLGIDIELANRVAMGPGLAPPRFRWVAFDDALLLPFNPAAVAAASPDRLWFYPREEKLLEQYRNALGVVRNPPTLAAYVAQIVEPTLRAQQQHGAVAIKFEAAYLRALDFQPPNPAAAGLYARYATAGVPTAAEARMIEDAMFHAIALDAGRLGLAVHLHTGFGCGSYFDLAGSNPLLLLPVFDDPSLRGTNFVLLHGGNGPFTKIVAALLAKPNVYTDTSGLTWLLPTHELAQVLRYWLEFYPEKVMFGTDLSPGAAPLDWEEVGWQTSNNARDALAIALTGMMNDHEVTRARALAIAQSVLRGNAERLYGFPAH